MTTQVDERGAQDGAGPWWVSQDPCPAWCVGHFDRSDDAEEYDWRHESVEIPAPSGSLTVILQAFRGVTSIRVLDRHHKCTEGLAPREALALGAALTLAAIRAEATR